MSGTVHRLPSDADLRAEVARDPRLLDRLWADRDRVGREAVVASRFAADAVRSRFQVTRRSLPSWQGMREGSPEHTAATVEAARHLLEEIACYQAVRDGAPHLTDVRSFTRAGAEAMKAATFDKAAEVQRRADDVAAVQRVAARFGKPKASSGTGGVR